MAEGYKVLLKTVSTTTDWEAEHVGQEHQGKRHLWAYQHGQPNSREGGVQTPNYEVGSVLDLKSQNNTSHVFPPMS